VSFIQDISYGCTVAKAKNFLTWVSHLQE